MTKWNGQERRKDNWTLIVKQYAPLIGTKWGSPIGKIYTFFGLVHGDDDYYYGLLSEEGEVLLSSCVGALEKTYRSIPPLSTCERCSHPRYENNKCDIIGCPYPK